MDTNKRIYIFIGEIGMSDKGMVTAIYAMDEESQAMLSSVYEADLQTEEQLFRALSQLKENVFSLYKSTQPITFVTNFFAEAKEMLTDIFTDKHSWLFDAKATEVAMKPLLNKRKPH